MKQDLYAGCNDQGVNDKEFMQMFCNVCKNRSCTRAGWATSRWDARISTQVDRLLLNPNIIGQGGTKWEEIPDFEKLDLTEISEVWGKPVDSKSVEIITPPSFVVETQETPPTEPPPPIEPPTPPVEPEAPPVETTPQQKVIPNHSVLNTPPPSQIMIGGAPLTPPTTQKPTADEWAVPPKKLKVGGTFKMGN